MKMVTHLTCMTPGREPFFFFFFFFNTPLFCQREFKALQTKRKEKSPQEPGTFVFLEMSGVQAVPKGSQLFNNDTILGVRQTEK